MNTKFENLRPFSTGVEQLFNKRSQSSSLFFKSTIPGSEKTHIRCDQMNIRRTN